MGLTKEQIQYAQIMADILYDATDNYDPHSERAYKLRMSAYQIHKSLKRYGIGTYKTEDIQVISDAAARFTAAYTCFVSSL